MTASVVKPYTGLLAWRKAMDLVEHVYLVTLKWPSHEQFGLTSQTRRAAVSIPANIAEGKGRTGAREFAHHLSIAQGSRCELETHLLIAHRLKYLDTDAMNDLLDLAEQVGQLTGGLLRRVRSNSSISSGSRIAEDGIEYDARFDELIEEPTE